MNRFPVYMVTALLTLAGLSIFAYKALVLGFPLKPNTKSVSWTVEAKIKFDGGNRDVNIRFPLPQGTSKFAIVNENFVSDDFGLNQKRDKKTGQRYATWTKRSASGAQTILYSAVLYELTTSVDDEKIPPPKVVSDYDAKKRKELKRTDPDPIAIALDQLINDASSRSSDKASLVRELLKLIANENDDRVKSLKLSLENVQEATSLGVFALKAAGIPARVVNGLEIQQNRRHAKIARWIEVYDDGSWESATLEKGIEGDEAPPRLPWWRGTTKKVERTGGPAPKVSYSVRRNVVDAVTKALWRESQNAPALRAFSLFDLPLQTQLLFRVMLLLPIGALLIAFFRQIIGIKTFGTFMPVLVSLAFRETQLLTGVILFTGIVALGLLLRSLLNRFQLLAVPRLAAVLTMVVVALVLIAKVSQVFGIHTGLSLSLFPVVILTMTIERMSVTWDEAGAREAIMQGLGSLAMAVICYLVIFQPIVGHYAFVFPELLMVALALMLLIGSYNGYKLTEYFRFRALQKQLEAKGQA